MGPIVLFDKSFLQSLNVGEAQWLDSLFISNICPLFFVETLADLAKVGNKKRTALENVRIIANKFPQFNSSPCTGHFDLCLSNLLSEPVVMHTGQIPVSQMRVVKVDGGYSGYMEESEESKAFSRWREGKFFEAEHHAAQFYRNALDKIDLSNLAESLHTIGLGNVSPKTLEDARWIGIIAAGKKLQTTKQFIDILEFLPIFREDYQNIVTRWEITGRPSIREFAPYAAFILEIEIFFRSAMTAGLISTKRNSHRVDICYLYYLPFCMFFVSWDKLHKQTASYFLRPNQDFVWGPDLKAALRWVNDYYEVATEEEKRGGRFGFAQNLPSGTPPILLDLQTKYQKKSKQVTKETDPEVVQEKFLEVVRRSEEIKKALRHNLD